MPAEKETKQKEEQAPKTKKERVDFEMLPKKVKQQIEKRKKKREELKLQRKLKIDFKQPEEKVLERYK